jgi:hypothetical protein
MPKKTEPEKPKARSGPRASAGKNPLKVIEETKIKAIREKTNVSRVSEELLRGWLIGPLRIEAVTIAIKREPTETQRPRRHWRGHCVFWLGRHRLRQSRSLYTLRPYYAPVCGPTLSLCGLTMGRLAHTDRPIVSPQSSFSKC